MPRPIMCMQRGSWQQVLVSQLLGVMGCSGCVETWDRPWQKPDELQGSNPGVLILHWALSPTVHEPEGQQTVLPALFSLVVLSPVGMAEGQRKLQVPRCLPLTNWLTAQASLCFVSSLAVGQGPWVRRKELMAAAPLPTWAMTPLSFHTPRASLAFIWLLKVWTSCFINILAFHRLQKEKS